MALKAETLARRKRRDARRRRRDAKNGRGYAAFQTGLTYHQALQMMLGTPSRNNPSRLREIHRRAVLGFMRELKLQLWQQWLEQRAEARKRKRCASMVPF